MKARETPAVAAVRWKKLDVLREHYKEFVPFLRDVMTELGFDTTEVQEEIGNFIAYGPMYLMVEAQRGQAKTTIAAAFAVWSLIHDPAGRVLVLSAGGTQATEISTLIVRIILTMPELECLRPDKSAGDRESVEAFDVHHSLKGLDKSPSVACVGIEANLQGKRATLLIADDIESQKNAMTSVQRAKLLNLTKDFTSICNVGRILWLGTPQTMDSIYNTLPSRGVTIRIWPGRYPTPQQIDQYQGRLAPSILERLRRDPPLGTGGGMLGDQGKPIDPQLLDEDALQKKELDQGTAYFQLQHMLNTTLVDSMRHPLKPELLVTLAGSGSRYPMMVVRGMENSHRLDFKSVDFGFQMMAPHEVSRETAALQDIWAYVDPAAGGANADETAYAVGGFLNGNIVLLSVGGIPGGYKAPLLEDLARRLAKFKPNGITIEKNMGYGAFREVFTPILRKQLQCQIDDDLVTGQKELRIINTLAPVMGRGALIVHPDAVLEDNDCCMQHSPEVRQTYSLFYQLAKLSAQRNALLHDDRADALEGLVRHYQAAIAQDQAKTVAKQRERELAKLLENPLGYNRPAPQQRPNLLSRFRGRR